MSLNPDLEEQQLLADTYRRAGVRLSPRELLARDPGRRGPVRRGRGAVVGISRPARSRSGQLVVCVLVLALATVARFDTPIGFTVPTQLAFVPLLFALPLALVVPVGRVGNADRARCRDVATGEMPPSRF